MIHLKMEIYLLILSYLNLELKFLKKIIYFYKHFPIFRNFNYSIFFNYLNELYY